MKQLHHIYVFLILWIPVAFQSCIQDDLSDCVSEKRIYFDYELTSSSRKGEGINPMDITRMNLFIFDENGLFVKECIDEAPQMQADYFMTVTGLTAGRYRLVAWGNLKEHYAVSSALEPGKTTFNDLQVVLKPIENDEVKAQLAPLFFATHTESNTIEVLGMSAQFIHLNLVQDTYKVNVTVTGVDSTLNATSDHIMRVEDDNGIYRFDNDFATCRQFVYTQPCQKISKQDLKSSLTILRLAANRHPLLSVINQQTREVVLKEDLVKLIQDAALANGVTVDFNKTHEFDIKYELASALEVVIYINGWKLIRQPGVLN
jgi:hypothetical protein